MTETTRIPFIAPLDMAAALKIEADERGAPVAAVIRLALADWLERKGHRVTVQVERGGYRPARNGDEVA